LLAIIAESINGNDAMKSSSGDVEPLSRMLIAAQPSYERREGALSHTRARVHRASGGHVSSDDYNKVGCA
jgi:hypothetical protein